MDLSKEKDNKFLRTIEVLGNKLPDISVLFLYALLLVWGLSFALSFISFEYYHPATNEQIKIVNMLHPKELVNLLGQMVKNYVQFPPLGLILLISLGVGLAEGSGLLQTFVRKGSMFTSPKFLTPTVALIAILCNIIADSAYVILMPMASLLFYTNGRHPLAGIAASFAALAGGFAASYFPAPIDPIMQGFTQSAAQLLDSSYEVNVLCNYFFSVASTFFVIGITWFITDKIVEPRLIKTMPVQLSEEDKKELELGNQIHPQEHKALVVTSMVLLLMAGLLVALLIPENSLFRAPNGSLTSREAPIMQGIIPVIFLFFAIPGVIFGFVSGNFKTSKDVARSMAKMIEILAGFIVFSFFCAQFLYVFGKSNLGILLAISGAEFIKSLNTPPQITIFGIILITSLLNIIITSASSKWAILGAIFVPMLMSVGIAPELTQAAFRLSDAAVNVSTPMFPFYPLLISYGQKYCKNFGVGSLCSMMIPYTIGLLIVLSIVLYCFWALGLPLGINSSYVYPKI